MNPQQQAQFIQQQRSQGISDDQILASLNQSSSPAPQRSGAGEILPTVFSVAGGIGGGALGSFGGPVGTFAGGVAGASAGGALGERIQQGIEQAYGQRQKINSGQIAAQGALSGVTQAVGGALFKGASLVGSKVAKPVFLKVMSKLSGFDDNVLTKALTRSQGVVQGLREGESALKDVVIKTSEGVSNLAKETLKDSSRAIADFSKLAKITGPGLKREILNTGKNFLKKTTDSLRANYNIGVRGNGELLFDRGERLSNIVTGGDKSTIQTAYNAIRTIPNKLNIPHVDSVLERLIVLRSKTPTGTPTGPETRRIVGEMSENVIDFVKSIPPTFGRGWGEYAQFLEQNLPKRVMISDAKEIFGSGRLSPKEVSQVTKRVLQLFNTGNLAQREFAEQVGKQVGQEITETGAGTLMNTGGQVSVRAPQLTKEGAFTAIMQAIPNATIKQFVKTGQVTPELTGKLGATANALGISVKALLQEFINMSANKTTR